MAQLSYLSHDDKQGSVPWLDQPVRLHSSRTHTCMLPEPDCKYRNDSWRDWYQADHVYALGTVYFCLSIITILMIIRIVAVFSTPNSRSSSLFGRLVAAYRYLSYRQYHIIGLYTLSLGKLLLLLVGMIFFTVMTFAPSPYYWPTTNTKYLGKTPPLAIRTGWMALALLPFVIILGSKANLITSVSGISHEKLLPFHQWTLYAMFILALIHTFPFVIYQNQKGDLSRAWKKDVAYWSGTVTIVILASLICISTGPVRRRFYEVSKILRIITSFVFVLCFFFHCNFRLSSWDYFIASTTLYFSSIIYSLFKTLCVNGTSNQAFITPLPGGTLRVQIPVRSATKFGIRMSWLPGQHVFVRFISMGAHALTAHPFAICSLSAAKDREERSEIVLIIRPHRGFTRRLASLARERPGKAVSVLLDGPYGGLTVKSLADFNTALIIASGTGAGFTLPIIEDILSRKDFEEGGVNHITRIGVVIVTRSLETRDWYSMEMQRLLYRYASAEFLKVEVFITKALRGVGSNKLGPFEDFSLQTPNSSLVSALTVSHGRPDLQQMIKDASITPYTPVGIVACGPSELLYDVRKAAATTQLEIMRGGGIGEVYLHTQILD